MVYSPIFDEQGLKVLAVVEFYSDATRLKEQLANAGWHSWGIMVGITTAFALLIFGVFHHGGTVIGEQQLALDRTLVDQSALAAQNNDLKAAIAHAYLMSAEVTDKAIRRLGADLHDGPAQLLTLALVQLDELEHAFRKTAGAGELPESVAAAAKLRSSLQAALKEVRDISAGASLPELDGLSTAEVVWLAVQNHQETTCSDVSVNVEDLPVLLPPPIKTCVYRVIQEGLTNAHRHGHGKGLRVQLAGVAEGIEIIVSDRGPGFALPIAEAMGRSLGLQGLKHRVEALGGRFRIASSPNRETRLVATLPTTASM